MLSIFFALELIRIRIPELYNTIRENQRWFSGVSLRGLNDNSRNEEREFHESWIARIDPKVRSGVVAMLHRIFPRLDSSGYDSGFVSAWRKTRRAASPDTFGSYFTFTLASDQLGRQDLIAFITNLDSAERTHEMLRNALEIKKANGETKAKDYLTLILDFDDEIIPEKASNLLKALVNLSDELCTRVGADAGFLAIPVTWRVMYAVQHALGRVPFHERDAEILNAFRTSTSLSFLIFAISSILQAKEKNVQYGPSSVLTGLADNTVTDLKLLAISRIRFAVDANTLQDSPSLRSVIHAWENWGDPDEVRIWARSLATDKFAVISILEKYIIEEKISTFGDSVAKISFRLDLRKLQEILDLRQVSLVLDEAPEELTLRSKLAVRIFKAQYPAFNKGGDEEFEFLG